jgi:hypothetical protein
VQILQFSLFWLSLIGDVIVDLLSHVHATTLISIVTTLGHALSTLTRMTNELVGKRHTVPAIFAAKARSREEAAPAASRC